MVPPTARRAAADEPQPSGPALPEPARPALRADAQRNRERILQAASEALLESGDASLNSIAKKASVGIGTLYRHFPTREVAGTIRPGLDPDDVLLMMGFLWRIDPQSDWRARANRLLDLLMDGLQAGAPNPVTP